MLDANIHTLYKNSYHSGIYTFNDLIIDLCSIILILIHVEFTRNVPVLLQIVLYYSILLHLPKIKQAIVLFEGFYLTNRGLYSFLKFFF